MYNYWASLVTQMVKHLSATQETWVQSLGWEDCLEKEMTTHSSILYTYTYVLYMYIQSYTYYILYLHKLYKLIHKLYTYSIYVLEASLVAQLVKNSPVMQETWETWVRSLGWEDPLEKGMATHSSILAWRIPWTGSLAGYSPWVCKESDMTEKLSLSYIYTIIYICNYI